MALGGGAESDLEAEAGAVERGRIEGWALSNYGAWRAYAALEAARAVGLPTVFGTEITLTPGITGRLS